MIGDGGIWAEVTPCQIQFVHTTNGVISSDGLEREQAYLNYLRISAIYILEAMVFGTSWSMCWDRLKATSKPDREHAMTVAFNYFVFRFGGEFQDVTFQVKDGYQ